MLSKTATMVFLSWLAVAMAACGTEAWVEARGLWAIDGDTIMAELADGTREEVRIISVNAPGLAACLGDRARTASEALIKGRTIWLELDPERGMDRRYQDRLLAHVFMERVQTPSAHLGTRLVEQGLAKLDVRDPRDTWPEDHFDIRYASWIIAAQVEAAKRKSGWWGECDHYRDSDLVIAAIKQWGDAEVVYIVNRGLDPVDLALGWKLASDPKAAQTLEFGRYMREFVLPPRWVLRVYSSSIATRRGGEYSISHDERAIDWYWTGRTIWRSEADVAWLIREDQTRYHYVYPPKEWD